MLEDFRAEITCPHCGEQFEKTAAWLNENTALDCPVCGKAIALDFEKFRNDIRQAEDGIADFSRTIDSLNKAGKKRP